MVYKSSTVTEMGDHLATINRGQKVGGVAVPLSVAQEVTPSNIMSPGLRPTSIPSVILIHPALGHNKHGQKVGELLRPFWGRSWVPV